MTEFPVHVYHEKAAGAFWELPGAEDNTTRSLTACAAGERRKPKLRGTVPSRTRATPQGDSNVLM